MTPAEFVSKWKDNDLSERAGAQAFFLDLCDLLDVEQPNDPDNSASSAERHAPAAVGRITIRLCQMPRFRAACWR
jgi:hypothetical protein